MDSAGNLETVTTYIGPFEYKGRQGLTGSNNGIPADTLQFFGDPEGRVRVEADTTGGISVPSYKFDYFLKDHLGDTRMVLTDEQQTDMYPAATMEIGDSATENLYYMNLDSTRSALPPGYPTDTTTNPNNYVAKVSGSSSGPVIGPGIVLKVMTSDEFSIRVSSWYQLNGTTPGTPVNPLTDILAHLIAGMAGIPNPENPGLVALQNNSPVLSSNVLNFLQDTGSSINSSKPHAFVNWILLDNQFNYVAASSGFSQVGNNGELHITTLTNLPVTSSGYLYIYTSNETPNVDVFFDNLQVTHTRGPLLEENHYYPFGLTMAGVSDKALKTNYAENKYRYNGKELQHQEFSDGTGLEEYDYGARLQDPQLGVWHGVDPMADDARRWSPYAYTYDNPMRFTDLDGMEAGGVDQNENPTPPEWMLGYGGGPGKGSGGGGSKSVSGKAAPMTTINGQLAAIINGQPVPAQELPAAEVTATAHSHSAGVLPDATEPADASDKTTFGLKIGPAGPPEKPVSGGIFGYGWFIWGSGTSLDDNGLPAGDWVHVQTAYFDDDVQTAFDAAANVGRPDANGPERNDPSAGFERVKDANTEPNSDGIQHYPKPANSANPVGGRPGSTQYRRLDGKPAILGPHDTTRYHHLASNGATPDTFYYANPQ